MTRERMTVQDQGSGVSVVICCHNSTSRIADVLRHVAEQIPTRGMEWELVLVDNASTDGTAEHARHCWQKFGSPVPMTIIAEPQAGLLHARKAGIKASTFPFILFCDDDNLLDKRYLSGVNRILKEKPQVAACGGTGVPLFRSEKPQWFDHYREVFATGPQDINEVRGRLLSLYGAGICLRRSALDQLDAKGFQPRFVGRKGSELSSSEDTELTHALVLSGHELYWDPNLIFHHVMPPERMTMSYLKRIFQANGREGPILNLYHSHLIDDARRRHIRNWWVHLGLSLFRFGKYFILPPKPKGRSLYFIWNLAYLRSLLSLRKEHAGISDAIAALKAAVPRPVAPASAAKTPAATCMS